MPVPGRYPGLAWAWRAVLTLGEWVHEGLVSGGDRRAGLLWLANFGVALGKLEANRLRQVRVEPNTLL